MPISLSRAVEQSYLIAFRPVFRATRSVAFAALTDPGRLGEAFGGADADLREGGFLRWNDPVAGDLVGGSLLEWRPGESFVLEDEASGGYFEIKLVPKEERTAVSVRFYAASAQPRQVLDLLTRRIG